MAQPAWRAPATARFPAPRAEWLDRLPEEGRHLALLDAREAALADLERDWFAPLLAALRAGRVGMVTLHALDGTEEVSFETIRGDLRRFWRTGEAGRALRMKIVERAYVESDRRALLDAGLHPVLARVYAGRRIRTASELSYGLDGLISPQALKGVDAPRACSPTRSSSRSAC